MEARNQASKIACLADFVNESTSWIHSCNVETNGKEQSSPVRLELELELGSGPTVYRKKSRGFTILQIQELQLQSLIYKYMEAGLRVPFQLVIPIWKSAVSSFNGLNGPLHQLYPSFSYKTSQFLSFGFWTHAFGVKKWDRFRAGKM